jgi:hypothetical protein
MRGNLQVYLVRLGLILAFQAVMVWVYYLFSTSPRVGIGIIAGILVPFIGYLAAFYRAPSFAKLSPSLKAGVLTFASLVLTLAVYKLMFTAGIRITGKIPAASSTIRESSLCVCGVTKWSRFSPEDGTFSVLMPTRPIRSIITNNTPAGFLVLTQFTSEVSKKIAFSIAQNQFPLKLSNSRNQEAFETALKFALGSDGKIVSGSPVQLQGHEGREWRFTKINGQALVTMRVFLVNQELFQIMCVMPKKRFCPIHSRAFLDSFQLPGKPKSYASPI